MVHCPTHYCALVFFDSLVRAVGGRWLAERCLLKGEKGPFGNISKEKKDQLFKAREDGHEIILGANGEFITLPRCDAGGILDLVPEGENVELLGPFGIRYGVISKSGDITLEKRLSTDFQVNPVLCPKRWPYMDAKRGVMLDIPKGVVFCEKSSSSTDAGQPPNVIGWAILGALDEIIFPLKEMKRPQNVLWIVKKGKGFQFVHSGPERQGVYLEVAADRTVTSSVQIDEPPPHFWVYVDRDSKEPVACPR